MIILFTLTRSIIKMTTEDIWQMENHNIVIFKRRRGFWIPYTGLFLRVWNSAIGIKKVSHFLFWWMQSGARSAWAKSKYFNEMVLVFSDRPLKVAPCGNHPLYGVLSLLSFPRFFSWIMLIKLQWMQLEKVMTFVLLLI